MNDPADFGGLSGDSARLPVQALVISRLDYSNSVLALRSPLLALLSLWQYGRFFLLSFPPLGPQWFSDLLILVGNLISTPWFEKSSLQEALNVFVSPPSKAHSVSLCCFSFSCFQQRLLSLGLLSLCCYVIKYVNVSTDTRGSARTRSTDGT